MLLRNPCRYRADQVMSCQCEIVRCPTLSKSQIVTLVSSVNPQRPKQMGSHDRRLVPPPVKSVALSNINSNRNTLLLQSINRCKANRSIEALANGNHLNSSRMRLYLHHSNFPLLPQTRRMFRTQHIKLVQGLTQGGGQTEILGVLILWQDSMPYARLETP